MNDQFWQSLPREVDITPEDWRTHFNFWDSLPKEEITPEPVNRFNVIGVLFWVYAIIAAVYVIWHFA